MRRYFYPLLAFVAQTALVSPIDADDALHLLNRTTFGPTVAEIAENSRLLRREAVDRLLDKTTTEPATPVSVDLTEYMRPNKLRDASEAERKRIHQDLHRRGVELRAWWVHRDAGGGSAGDGAA